MHAVSYTHPLAFKCARLRASSHVQRLVETRSTNKVKAAADRPVRLHPCCWLPWLEVSPVNKVITPEEQRNKKRGMIPI